MAESVDINLKIASSAQEVAGNVDILSAATTAVSPILQRGWVPEGTLFCQMGSYECELESVKEYDKLVVDNWDQVQHRGIPVLAMAKAAGVISDADIYAEMGEIINGKKPARESDSERIYFSAVGMGLLDIAVGTRILRSAEDKGIGRMLNLWGDSDSV